MSELTMLRSRIDRAAQNYYTPGGMATITDEEYDGLLQELRALDPTDMRLTRVGTPFDPSGLREKAPHKQPMGSLDNAVFDKWLTSQVNRFGEVEVLCSFKMDGSSISLEYKAGVLVKALSRGDGSFGEDLTANAVRWLGVPTVLPTPIDLLVRGEAMLYLKEFNELKEKRGEGANARNLGNGIIGRLDGQDNEYIRLVAFNAYSTSATTMAERLELLENCGFTVVRHFLLSGSADLIRSRFQAVYSKLENEDREKLPFEIDGLVVALNSIEQQESLITSPKDQLRPKHSAAIKFTTQKRSTTLLDVLLTVGHNGQISPTAKLAPVVIGGVTVEHALLNNWDEIARLDLHFGDTVMVERAGDVIPKIISATCPSDERGEPLVEPKTCPGCGGPTTRLVRGKPGAVTYCVSPRTCPEALSYKVKHFIQAMDIQGIGEGVLAALLKSGLIKTPVDLYSLEVEKLADLQVSVGRLGISRAKDIVKSIQQSRTAELAVFLAALGIDLLGRRRAEMLIEERGWKTIEDWLTKLEPEATTTTLQTIHAGLQECREQIGELLKHITISEVEAPSGGDFSNYSFCFTGTRECVDEVVARGGTIKSGVSKGLHYLVQLDALSRSVKSQKAESYGTKIISLETLKRVLAGQAQLP